jgi:PEP-CTERM motif
MFWTGTQSVRHPELLRNVLCLVCAFGFLGTLGTARARADLYVLNTGIDTSPPGGPEAATDNLWRVSYTYPAGGNPTVDSLITVTGSAFPFGHWFADSATSEWLTPSNFNRNNAPPPSSQPPVTFSYFTTFNLTASQAQYVSINGLWSSDNNGVEIDLNGNAVWTGDTGLTAFTGWHPFSIGSGSGFHAGTNTLLFQVVNESRDLGNPTGFRLEGSVATPEPSTMLVGLFGGAFLGIGAWRGRKKTIIR